MATDPYTRHGVWYNLEDPFGVFSYGPTDDWYNMFIKSKAIGFPDPEQEMDETSDYNSRNIDYWEKTQRVSGQQSGILFHWIPLWLALGKAINTTESGYFQHVLSPILVDDELPSICYHKQHGKGSLITSPFSVDAFGNKVTNFKLEMKLNTPTMATLSTFGQKVINGTETTSLAAFKDPTGALRRIWKMKSATLTFGGTQVAQLISAIIEINLGCTPIPTQSGGQYVEFVNEADELHFTATLGWILYNDAIWNDFLAATSRQLILNNVRGGDANDACAITLDPAKSRSFKTTIPDAGIGKMGAVTIMPCKTITATVKDQIPAAFYGG